MFLCIVVVGDIGVITIFYINYILFYIKKYMTITLCIYYFYFQLWLAYTN